MRLTSGQPLPWWQTTPLAEARYDVPDAPMQGEMDSTFFLTKDKNYIPHTYPCRTAYIAEFRDPPQKKVSGRLWSVTTAFTCSTSQMWCRCRCSRDHPAIGSSTTWPVVGSSRRASTRSPCTAW